MNAARRSIEGCILGTAVGDAIGLACEGLSRRRQLKLFPELAGYRLVFGRGLCSDDTEHTVMLAQSLIEASGGDPDHAAGRFATRLAWRLRWWLLALPAGIGFATLRAILKLWVGFPPRASGVFSAGNGPAMRIALIGVCHGGEPERMRALVRAATRITHTDPKAEYGALAIALAGHFAAAEAAPAPADYAARLRALLGDDARELLELVDGVARSVNAGETGAQHADSIGCGRGVSGYIYDTVPVALHAWLRHPEDYRAAVLETIRLGGDTDTVAAIVGGLVGARVGKRGIPQAWLRDLWEWPRTVGWMETLAGVLAESCADGRARAAPGANPLALAARNFLFMLLVLAHGLRRLLPPY